MFIAIDSKNITSPVRGGTMMSLLTGFVVLRDVFANL